MDRPRALIVDKDPSVRAVIREVLEEREVMALGASSVAEAVETLKSRPVQLVVVGTPNSGSRAALEVLEFARALQPPPTLLAVVAEEDENRAEDLLQRGAFEAVQAPVDAASLREPLRRALREVEQQGEIRRLRRELQSREGYSQLVGRSAFLERTRQQLEVLAATDTPVWFHGEGGSGKELAARTLHAASSRHEQPFVVVACTGTSELDWKGQWQSMVQSRDRDGRTGPLHQALGGTVYLDELPALPLELQEDLLPVLAGDLFRSPNDSTPAAIRVLAASSGDPEEEVAAGRLHDGLYRRLAGGRVGLPPLRERVEDIPLLARHFVSTVVEINHLHSIDLSRETLSCLDRYDWPGNVQELRNAIEHAVILAVDGAIEPRDLPDRVRDAPAARPGHGGSLAYRRFRDVKREVIESFERAYLCELLDHHRGNVTSAAQQAGMLRSALQRLLRKYGLKSVEFRQRRRTPVREEPQRSSETD